MTDDQSGDHAAARAGQARGEGKRGDAGAPGDEVPTLAKAREELLAMTATVLDEAAAHLGHYAKQLETSERTTPIWRVDIRHYSEAEIVLNAVAAAFWFGDAHGVLRMLSRDMRTSIGNAERMTDLEVPLVDWLRTIRLMGLWGEVAADKAAAKDFGWEVAELVGRVYALLDHAARAGQDLAIPEYVALRRAAAG